MPKISSPVLIGRGPELKALDRAQEEAASGERSALLIGGDAGVGKSRLISTWAERARVTGSLVVVGTCLDLGDVGPPFTPIIPVMRGLYEAVEPGRRSDLLGRWGSEIALLLPELAETAPEPADRPSAPSTQSRLFEAILGCIEAAARSRPTTIVVEDMHVSDESTRLCLTFLIEASREPGVLFIATYRTDDLHRRHPLRPFLAHHARSPRVESLELRPFDRLELGSLVRAIVGEQPTPAVVESFFQRTEGNAFLTEELLASGGGDPGAPVPGSMKEAMLGRVGALGPLAEAVVRVAAAAGTPVRIDLIAAAAGMSDADFIAAIRPVVAANLLVPLDSGSRLRFRHALLREVVYDDMISTERRRVHQAIAVAIEADRSLVDGGHATATASLAHHWALAQETDRAMLVSIEAGEAAEAMTAYREARQQYERAAELWERAHEGRKSSPLGLVDILERASECARLGGEYPRAIQFAEATLRGLDPAAEPFRVADILVRLSWMLSETADNRRGLALAREAVRIAPADPPTSTRARALAALASFLGSAGDPIGARRVLEEALEIGDQIDEAWPRIELMTYDIYEGHADRAIETARRVADHAALKNDRETEAAVLAALANDLVDVGLLPAGLAAATEAIDVADGAGLGRGDGAWARFAAAEALLRLGRPGEAAQVVAKALSEAPEGKVNATLHTLAAHIDEHRGDLASAQENLSLVRVDGIPPEEQLRWAYFAQIRVRVALAEARPSDALEMGLASINQLNAGPALSVTNRRRLIPLAAVTLTAAAECAELANVRRDQAAIDAARLSAASIWRCVDRLERARADAGLPEPAGLEPWRLWCRAELERLEGQSNVASWAHVADAFEVRGEPFPAAEARYRQAEAILSRAGSKATARDVLRAAYRSAQSMDASPLVARLELIATRARIQIRLPAAPPDATVAESPTDRERVLRDYGLTKRERQVLGLLGDGWSNRQIADHLFITESTAGVHVANVVHKMALESRVAAGIAASRLGLSSKSVPDDAR